MLRQPPVFVKIVTVSRLDQLSLNLLIPNEKHLEILILLRFVLFHGNLVRYSTLSVSILLSLKQKQKQITVPPVIHTETVCSTNQSCGSGS